MCSRGSAKSISGGFASVSENVIRRQLTFKPGDRFTRRDLRETQRKLCGLELFEFVNVEPLEEPVLMNEEVPVRITVAEGKHQKVTTGVGYGTEEQARARVRWDHRNVFGGAQQAGVEAKWSSLDRGVRVDYREPFFLSSRLSLNFDGQAWQAKEPVYDSKQLGGRVILRYQPNQQSFWTVSFANERQESTIAPEALADFTIRDDLIALGLDPTTGGSRGTLSAVAFDISRNTTNSLLNATSGYVLNGHVEQAGRLLWGSYNFWAATAEGRASPFAGESRSRTGSASAPSSRPRTTRRTCRSTAASSWVVRRAFAGGGASTSVRCPRVSRSADCRCSRDRRRCVFR